jgi:hypothetical protein
VKELGPINYAELKAKSDPIEYTERTAQEMKHAVFLPFCSRPHLALLHLACWFRFVGSPKIFWTPFFVSHIFRFGGDSDPRPHHRLVCVLRKSLSLDILEPNFESRQSGSSYPFLPESGTGFEQINVLASFRGCQWPYRIPKRGTVKSL